jgi:hydroxypyruvate reductase
MPFPKAYPTIPHQIVANQKMALLAAESRAKEWGYKVYLHSEFLEGETSGVAKYLSSYLQQAPAGVHLWGGETVVTLSENPGRGGRNQHLALQVAVRICSEKNIIFLAAGSDGTDGVTKDAGAMVDSESCMRGENAGLNAARMLRQFNAGSFFEASGDLVSTGPTGTNVMDFVMSIKQ